METPSFLIVLGLGLDADERAIRRAYAQRLKLIDQETDPAAFQLLREAFESAGRWVGERHAIASQDAPVPAQKPPLPSLLDEDLAQAAAKPPLDPLAVAEHQLVPLAPMSEPRSYRSPWPGYGDQIDPQRHVNRPRLPLGQASAAGEVFEEFAGRLAQAGQSGDANADSIRNLLAQALDDPRLVNIPARFAFEFHVAELLVNGWRAGHEHLLDAAIASFRWREDQPRLAALGGIGVLLDRALTERDVFLKAADSAATMRLRVMERLCDPRPPTEQEVSAYYKVVLKLYIHYPNWLRMVTNLENFHLWRDGAHNLAEEINGRRRQASQGDSHRLSSALGVLIVLVAFFVLLDGFIYLITPK